MIGKSGVRGLMGSLESGQRGMQWRTYGSYGRRKKDVRSAGSGCTWRRFSKILETAGMMTCAPQASGPNGTAI